MSNRFTQSLIILGSIFLLFVVLFFGSVLTDGTVIGDWLANIIVFLLCASPLAVMYSLGTGAMLLWRRINSVQKKSVAGGDYDFGATLEDDSALADIMQQLTPEQQAYLEERLEERALGLGTDGELMSMDELLNEARGQKPKRDSQM
ncbi:MAG: hypothetical protein AAFR67_03100 [Chloroflexota bacterium]